MPYKSKYFNAKNNKNKTRGMFIMDMDYELNKNKSVVIEKKIFDL